MRTSPNAPALETVLALPDGLRQAPRVMAPETRLRLPEVATDIRRLASECPEDSKPLISLAALMEVLAR